MTYRWWIRFPIFLVVTTVMVAVLFVCLGDYGQRQDVMYGVMTLAGQFLLFLAFDAFGDMASLFGVILRYVLTALGAAAVLTFGIISTVIFANSVCGNPWIYSFFVLWLMSGVISYYLFYVIHVTCIKQILYTFVPFVSVVLSYVSNAALLYLSGTDKFFNGYLSMTLCILGVVGVIVLIVIKQGIPFYGTSTRWIRRVGLPKIIEIVKKK